MGIYMVLWYNRSHFYFFNVALGFGLNYSTKKQLK